MIEAQQWLLSQELHLVPVKRSDEVEVDMSVHYSMPKGFVGRSIVYSIVVGANRYGTIAGGSATKHLPGRKVIGSLNNGVNNIFFHIEKVDGKYPMRNFAVAVLRRYRTTIEEDWERKYGDTVFWHETLVELPRTGECYKRDRWSWVGETKGFTCKRVAGKGTDSWGGKRVWDKKNLRPKIVLVRTTRAASNLNKSASTTALRETP